jgi:hypothetical protein
MTEEAIVKLGFTKVIVPIEESDSPPFYYYNHRIGNIDFLSNASDGVEDGLWYIEILEGNVKFYKLLELKIVMDLMERNKIS